MIVMLNISLVDWARTQLDSKRVQSCPWQPDPFAVGIFIAFSSFVGMPGQCGWSWWASDKMNISQVGDAVGPIFNTNSSEHLR
jgi:hypothetical protein